MCRSHPRGRASAGFTLIELLVGLVISGLLAAVIFQLIDGQGRFVRQQSAREEVQQNARASLELITSELRAVPPGGIVSAGASSITFRLPRTWGILCNDLPAGSGTAWVILPPGTFPSDFPTSFSQASEWGLAVQNAGFGYDPATFAGTQTGTVACAANPELTKAPVGEIRGFSVAGVRTDTSYTAGTRIFLYQTVSYSVGQATAPLTGDWLLRKQSAPAGSPQPMAGPLRHSAESPGLAFTYYGATAPLPLPVNPLDVRRIQVRVAAQSREKVGSTPTDQVDSLLVHLRSR